MSVVLVACVGVLLSAGLGYLWLPGGGLRIFSELHRRADRIEQHPPSGLTLVRRYDEGPAICPLECGSAHTVLEYSGSGLDDQALCRAGAAELTDLFGEPRAARGMSGPCPAQIWPLPGVYRDLGHASLSVKLAHDDGGTTDGSVLVVTLDSGRV